ncbi:MAG: hypothetical protein C4536_13310 [Actinobacteria bacterium]|jgi:hypothetical protein|nr:MAG: hypothetical protein C4536_13310 [Actinomycetota bacterium]
MDILVDTPERKRHRLEGGCSPQRKPSTTPSPSRKQAELSIDRGHEAGLSELDASRFRFALSYRAEIASAHGVSKAWFKQLDALFDYLTSRKWESTSEVRYRLPEEEYENTVEEYLRSL